jgi:hypothetical protein
MHLQRPGMRNNQLELYNEFVSVVSRFQSLRQIEAQLQMSSSRNAPEKGRPVPKLFKKYQKSFSQTACIPFPTAGLS